MAPVLHAGASAETVLQGELVMRSFPLGLSLAVLVLAVLPFSGIVRGKEVQVGRLGKLVGDEPERTLHVDVYLRDASRALASVSSREIERVRDVLRPCLTAAVDLDTVAADVGSVLAEAFPGDVHPKPAGAYYKAVWCSDIQDFKVVCCELEAFEVLLDRVVIVQLEVGTRLE